MIRLGSREVRRPRWGTPRVAFPLDGGWSALSRAVNGSFDEFQRYVRKILAVAVNHRCITSWTTSHPPDRREGRLGSRDNRHGSRRLLRGPYRPSFRAW